MIIPPIIVSVRMDAENTHEVLVWLYSHGRISERINTK